MSYKAMPNAPRWTVVSSIHIGAELPWQWDQGFATSCHACIAWGLRRHCSEPRIGQVRRENSGFDEKRRSGRGKEGKKKRWVHLEIDAVQRQAIIALTMEMIIVVIALPRGGGNLGPNDKEEQGKAT
uniref:Uncharacterized protein n=1 Tax=Oryza glumipatula TaxID=40148 RepID=A0A0D9ZZS6_9ORYZ